MPTFGGEWIFGAAVSMHTGTETFDPSDTFAGAPGRWGAGERFTNATGALCGATAEALASHEAAFRSYLDGTARPLVDTLGNRWENVRLVSFESTLRCGLSPGGVMFRPYKARFRHIGGPA